MKELQPVNQQVILDITENTTEKRTASGLIIPDSAAEKPKQAKVAWTSPVDKPEFQAGDKVLFKPFSGTGLNLKGINILFFPMQTYLPKL
jgi:chaperonin GroES